MYEIQQELIGDDRGWFSRVFETDGGGFMEPLSIFQVNNSFSRSKGTLRGLHWQVGDAAEIKVVRCIRGAVLDIVVDVRPESPSFGAAATVELSSGTPSIAVVPRGCAHGVMSLEDESEIIYWSDRPFVPGVERGMRFDDPFASLQLPFMPTFVSDKDLAWPDFTIS